MIQLSVPVGSMISSWLSSSDPNRFGSRNAGCIQLQYISTIDVLLLYTENPPNWMIFTHQQLQPTQKNSA